MGLGTSIKTTSPSTLQSSAVYLTVRSEADIAIDLGVNRDVVRVVASATMQNINMECVEVSMALDNAVSADVFRMNLSQASL